MARIEYPFSLTPSTLLKWGIRRHPSGSRCLRGLVSISANCSTSRVVKVKTATGKVYEYNKIYHTTCYSAACGCPCHGGFQAGQKKSFSAK